MSGVTLDQLPPALALAGNELVWIYQIGTQPTPYIGLSCTTGQLAALAQGTTGVATCSMRQLFAAMAAASVMVTAFEALPADMTNSYNIAWNHAYRMTIVDPFITGFLEPAISYNSTQMAALFASALAYPV